MPPIKSKNKIARTAEAKGPNSMGRSGSMLPEVTVTAKRTPAKPLAVKADTSRASLRNVPMPKIAKDSTKATAPKKMGRLGTAVSDATSLVRTGLNVGASAFKKDMGGIVPKTAVGKAAQRVLRAASGLGGTVGMGAITAYTAPAIIAAGQATYNKRDEASKKRGLLNVGKNLDYMPGQLSGSPQQQEKKPVRNSSAPLAETQFND